MTLVVAGKVAVEDWRERIVMLKALESRRAWRMQVPKFPEAWDC